MRRHIRDRFSCTQFCSRARRLFILGTESTSFHVSVGKEGQQRMSLQTSRKTATAILCLLGLVLAACSGGEREGDPQPSGRSSSTLNEGQESPNGTAGAASKDMLPPTESDGDSLTQEAPSRLELCSSIESGMTLGWVVVPPSPDCSDRSCGEPCDPCLGANEPCIATADNYRCSRQGGCAITKD